MQHGAGAGTGRMALKEAARDEAAGDEAARDEAAGDEAARDEAAGDEAARDDEEALDEAARNADCHQRRLVRARRASRTRPSRAAWSSMSLTCWAAAADWITGCTTSSLVGGHGHDRTPLRFVVRPQAPHPEDALSCRPGPAEAPIPPKAGFSPLSRAPLARRSAVRRPAALVRELSPWRGIVPPAGSFAARPAPEQLRPDPPAPACRSTGALRRPEAGCDRAPARG